MSPFEVTIEKIKFLLNYYGLATDSKITDKKKKIISRRVFILNFFWLNSDGFGSLILVLQCLITDNRFDAVTYIAPCTTLTCLSITKAVLFIYYEDKIRGLMTDLRELDQEFNKNIPEIQSDINFVHAILKTCKILNAMLWIVFCGSPLVVSLVIYMQSGVYEVIYPCLIWYPFDSYNPRYWPFVYIHQLGSVCIVLLNIQGSDYFLYICCSYLKMQFRLLCYDLKKTIDDNRFLPHKSFEEKCIPLIKWHQKLIKIAANVESVYTKSTLLHFVTASILICFTGFNVVEINNPAVTVMFLVFLSVNLAQIFLLCYLGDLLMMSTMEVREAIYDTKWYDIDSKGRKNLLFIHFRAQKPCKLTAYGFSDVNLKSFTSILSTAWSYFALLQTMSSPEEK